MVSLSLEELAMITFILNYCFASLDVCVCVCVCVELDLCEIIEL